ncbi:MAG: septal ring lytic transglycosylase RlpA family protein [Hyphomicrobium sp.]
MRFALLAALAVLTLGLVDAGQANAAWTCNGPEYVCGGSSATTKKAKAYSASKATRVASYEKRASKRPSKHVVNHTPRTSKSVANSGSYGGGSSGLASYYWQGQQTASGARFNPSAMTAAHRSLPFGTRVLVTNKSNGRSVTVTINDRGPFIKGRIIDLSSGAAGVIGMKGAGVAPVSISVLGKG